MATHVSHVIVAAAFLLFLLPFSFSFSISHSHRSAAINLFAATPTSLEDAYEALRVFQILGIEEKNTPVNEDTCQKVVESLASSSPLKDLFYALKVNAILKCNVNGNVFKDIASRLKATVHDASALLDIYYSIGGLVLIKDQDSNVDVLLADVDGVFQSIKVLSQSGGRWRYSSDNPESSTYAAGLALESLAGLISLASSEFDQSKVNVVKNGIVKFFDGIEKYEDETFYFDEKYVGGHEQRGSLSTTSSVVRGVTAFAAVTSGKINLPGDKILGLAKFFLGIGIPGDAKDFFNQVEISIPLILSLPETVYSLTKKGQLKVKVNTVLGSAAPPLTVKLVRAFSTVAKDSAIIDSKELRYDQESGFHVLDALPKNVDVGTYVFVFEIVLHDFGSEKVYATGGQIHVPIYVTGIIEVGNAEITAFFKLRHETKVEHIFVVGNTGKKFEKVLDFLGLVEKLFYLSGKYEIELTVGDAVMENSFLRLLGHVELDLPEAPEKAPRPPPPPVDPYSRYGPKAEITHIFRSPEKRPHQELSLAFLGLILLPFIGFLVGLLRLGVNLKNFPGSTVPATFGILFHVGIAAVLLLYVLFWLKLDLFTTLKAFGLLGAILMFVGHRILSHLAFTSAKLKSA
ncbi:Dolichyl-diphosphooligosaccharide--protein glycosyltransferase subunit 2 [Glycine max]|nr:Dolichyl-diphosphooligosaccharide--protein glycosyltransferase subunit 2 [Glycine max]